MKVKKPTPIMLHLYVYILPGAHLEGHRREGGQELRQRARARTASSAPARSSSMEHKKGQFIRLEAQPELLRAARRRSTSWCSGSSRTRTRSPRRCARRDRLRRQPRRQRLRQPRGRRGRQDLPGDVLRLRRDRVQHRRRTRRRHADRRRPPGAQGRQAARRRCRYADRHQDAGRPGARRPRHARAPASSRRSTSRCTTTRARRRTPSTRRRPRRCSTRRATPRGPDGIRTMPNGGQQAVVPAVRPRQLADQPAVGAVRRRLARGRRHRGRSRRSCPRTRSPRSSARATSTCSSGAGSSSPTRTTSCPRSPAPTGRTRTAAASTPTSPTRSTATRSTTRLNAKQAEQIDPAERAETVKAMQKMLYDVGRRTS